MIYLLRFSYRSNIGVILLKPSRSTVFLLALIISSLLSSFCFAQISAEISFTNFGIEDGLVMNTTLSSCQDSNGYLWFGTETGLCRYDGISFKTFIHDRMDPLSLSDDYVYALCPDEKGGVWIGTLNGGLNYYDAQSGKFRSWQSNNSGLSSDAIYELYLGKKNQLWIGTLGGGVDCLQIDSGEIRVFRYEKTNSYSICSNFIWSLLEDTQGRIWVGSRGKGLSILDPVTGKSKPFHLPFEHERSSLHVTSLSLSQSGNILIGTDGDGFHIYDPRIGDFQTFRKDDNNEDSLSSNRVWNLFEDDEKNIWVATRGGGLNCLSAQSGRFSSYQFQPDKDTSICSNYISSVIQDRFSMLWATSLTGGICRFDKKNRNFTTYRKNIYKGKGLLSFNVYAILEDSKKRLWVGTMDGGLTCIDRKRQTVKHYLHQKDDSDSLSHNYIRALVEDRQHRIWIGTWGGGVDCFDPESESFVHYSTRTSMQRLSNDYIWTLFLDSSNRLWIGSEGGVDRLHLDSGQYSHYQHDKNDSASLYTNRVWSIDEDSKHRIWVGLWGGGLNRYDSIFDNFETIPVPKNKSISKNKSHTRMISISPDDKLWLGALGDGLKCYDLNTKQWSLYSQIDGLVNNRVYSILVDADGKIWVSTNGGLSAFDPISEKWKNYHVRDGLQSNEFNGGSGFASDSGELFFGGVNGLNSFFPDRITENSTPPEVVLNDLYCNSSIVNVGQELFGKVILDRSLNSVSHIRIPPKVHTFTLSFVALHFQDPGKNEYQCRLLKYSKDWEPIGRNHSKTYANLFPGKYTFEVRAANKDGYWSEPISLAIIIERPYWQSWWFRLFWLVTIICLFIVIYLKRLKYYQLQYTRMQNKHLELQKQVKMCKTLEKKRLHLYEKQMTILNSISDTVIVMDASGVVIQLNPVARAYCYCPDRIEEGLHFDQMFRLMNVDTHQPHQGILESALSGHKSVEFGFPMELVCPDGSQKKVLGNISPILEENDVLIGAVFVMRDISDQYKLEEQFRRAQKMEMLGTLAGGLAHDFNNVLGGIIGTLSLATHYMAQEDIPIEKVNQYLTTIEKAAMRATDMVSQLRMLAQKQPLSFQIQDLNEILSHTVEICRNTFEKSVKLSFVKNDTPACVYADSASLDQVFLNLCMNAAHAMTIMRSDIGAYGGDLKISILFCQADQPFVDKFPHASESAYWQVRVSDTGVGMDPYTISKIFDPFFTTKRNHNGSGLGLAMVYNILSQHKGFIDVHSIPGEGSEFKLFFPARSDESPLEDPSVLSEELITGIGNILLVDDEYVVRETASEMLKTCGYKVYAAASGREALEQFKRYPDFYDLIILDLSMPEMPGDQVFCEMKRMNPNACIMISSGAENDPRIMKLQSLGCEGFLSKPYSLQMISKQVHKYLKKS